MGTRNNELDMGQLFREQFGRQAVSFLGCGLGALIQDTEIPANKLRLDWFYGHSGRVAEAQGQQVASGGLSVSG